MLVPFLAGQGLVDITEKREDNEETLFNPLFILILDGGMYAMLVCIAACPKFKV
jgi:hypothetical protein